MKKQKKQLICLLILLVLAVGAYLAARYLIVDEDLVKVEKVSSEVFHISKDDVKEVRYSVDGVTVDFVKDGEAWKLSDDKSIELDQNAVSNIIGFASYLNSKSMIDEPAALSEYGLEAPRYTVEVITNDGNDKCYYIGDKYVMGEEYFAKVKDSDVVYTIAGTYPNAFITDISQLTKQADDTNTSDAK